MKKEKVIGIIKSARESHEFWLRHGQILIDGVNLENAQAPVASEDCEFYVWFNSGGTKLRNFSWYKDVNQQYKAFHKSYSVLYYESMRMYNPKTRTELIERFDDLELQSNLYNKLLGEVYSELDEMIVADFEDKLVNEEPHTDTHQAKQESKQNVSDQKETKEDKHFDNNKCEVVDATATINATAAETNTEVEAIKADLERSGNFDGKVEKPTTNLVEKIAKDAMLEIGSEKPENNIKSESDPSVQGFMTSGSSDPHQQRQLLKEQDLKQIEQEKELTQLELNQLKERHKLIQQGIKQLEQYYLLKQQEIEIDQREHSELETKKLEVKSLKEKELAKLDSQMHRKMQELDQLEMVDQKLERKKQESDIFEKQQIAQLDEQTSIKLEDIKQIDKHLGLRQNDLKRLKDQVALVEQDIADLESQKDNKNSELERISEQKDIKIEQRDLEAQRQQKLDEHKAGVQKDKQKELSLLEQQQQLRKEELQAVKQALIDLGHAKTEVEVVKQRELRELEEQQGLKQESLTKIEKNQQAKRQEIRELELKQETIEKSLKEMKSQSGYKASESEESMMKI